MRNFLIVSFSLAANLLLQITFNDILSHLETTFVLVLYDINSFLIISDHQTIISQLSSLNESRARKKSQNEKYQIKFVVFINI